MFVETIGSTGCFYSALLVVSIPIQVSRYLSSEVNSIEATMQSYRCLYSKNGGSNLPLVFKAGETLTERWKFAIKKKRKKQLSK